MSGPGGMAGRPATMLPCAGGAGEQPAALMDAFALMDAWASEG
jgi:hypothetical protein